MRKFAYLLFVIGLLPPTRVAARQFEPAPYVSASAEQGETAATVSICGLVRTPQGVTVPSAAVRLLHGESGKAWETSTDDEGKFCVANVPVGHYRFEAHQLGLGTITREEDINATSSQKIELTLQRKAAVVTAIKPASAPSPTASVNAPKPGIANDTSAKSMPKRGNSKKKTFEQVEAKGTLQANAEVNSESAPHAIAQNSQPSSAESYLISGAIGRGSTAGAADANGPEDTSSGDTNSKPGKHHRGHSGNKKASAYAGPFGQEVSGGDNLAGSVTDLAVRDKTRHLGSNQVHLTVYNYYDNSAWDARNYALTGASVPKIAHFNERFGANLGGPLTVPKLYNGKDRTFWFVNYELDRRTDADDLFENVPTVPERSGNFCDRGIQLFDPLTGLDGPRQPFGCAIPTSRFNGTASKLLPLIPLPNLPGETLNYHRGARIPTRTQFVNFRLLHSFSPRFSLLGAYNFVESNARSVTSFPSLDGNAAIRDQNVTLTFTQNWTSRLINETKLNFDRSRSQVFSVNAFTNNVAAQDGFTGVSPAPIDYGVPLITFANLTALADPAASLVRNQTLRLFDGISYTRQRHTFRAGGEIRRRQLNTYTSDNARGRYDFSGLMTSQLDASGVSTPGTGFDFADFLLGLPATTTVQFGTNSNYGRAWQFISYAQDDWRVTPRFSVNVGVRYELFTPFTEKNNHLANLLVNPAVTELAVVVPGQSDPFGGTLPRALIRPQPRDFAPRVGIAWRPSNRGPVVRSGYGIFYNGAVYDTLFDSVLNQPPWAQSRALITSASQLLTLQNGFPPAPPDAVTNIFAVDPNYKVGYAQIWNLSVEQELGKNSVLELLYTGTKGTDLLLREDPNQATPGSVIGSDQRRRIPNASGFDYRTSGANSIYNGLQVRVQKRMSDGLRFLFLYTLGHSIDDASVIGIGHTTSLVQDYYNRRPERGNSFFDIRNDVRTWFYYDLPFGDRRRWLHSGISSKVFGNWHLSANTVLNSGAHLTPYITGQNTNGVGPLYSQRPDAIGNPNLPGDQRTNNRFFNVSAFSLPPTGSFGDASRGSIVGPGLFIVNAALGRRMHFGPDNRFQFEVRGEVQNLTNTANFSNVVTVVNSTNAGVVTGDKPMRSMDIMLRLHF